MVHLEKRGIHGGALTKESDCGKQGGKELKNRMNRKGRGNPERV
jgi:hypothetical protein